MSWDNIQGQTAAVNYLRQSVRKGRVAGAYLFQGPEGVGKELTARVLAQSLNCFRQEVEPCGRCPSCTMIEKGLHPDVFSLSPRGKSRSLGIEQTREMQRVIHLSAQLDGWKVFVVRDADTLKEAAADSLLKTLEEPPGKTVIILLSARPERLPATLRSRCQAIRFRPWPWKLMEPFLRQRGGLAPAAALVLNSIAGGQPGQALHMLEEGFLNIRETLLAIFKKPAFSSAEELIAKVESLLDLLQGRSRTLAAELGKKRAEVEKDLNPSQRQAWDENDEALLAAERQSQLEGLFELFFLWFRDVYIFQKTGSEEAVINRDRLELLRTQAQLWDSASVVSRLDWIEKSRKAALATTYRSSHQFILENLILQLGWWQPPT